MTRRKFILVSTVLLSGAIVWTCSRDRRGDLLPINPSSVPHEGYTHQKTWTSFGFKHNALDALSVAQLKENIILIASTIAQYEPVSILVGKADQDELSTLLGDLNTHHYPIEVVELEMNALWIRDTGPTFIFNEEGHKAGINFNISREEKELPFHSKATDSICTKASAKIIHSNLLLEGGCFELDGSGTAIMTESCIINDDRNPYWEKTEIETELKLLLGLKKIIWLKGIDNKECTNTHTDFYARFIKEGVVLVHRNNDKASYEYNLTRENIKILQAATDAQNNALEVVIMDAPKHLNKESDVNHFARGYLGYYLCNRAVIMQAFGDEEADYRAYKILQLAFPERTIEQIQIDALSSVGGYIHRATQQEPENKLV